MGEALSKESETASASSSTTRPRQSRKPASPLYTATVIETATSQYSKSGISLAIVDPDIVARIKKCLERATHGANAETTNDTIINEAKAAMRIADRLMKQNNIKQAEILANESLAAQKLFAGRSVVSIHHVDGDKCKGVRTHVYIGSLCDSMTCTFGCKYYTEKFFTDLRIVFYGIAEQTVAAAEAFRMVYNLAVEWAMQFKGQYRRNQYCLGIAHALKEEGLEMKRLEEKEAKRAQKAAMDARLQQEAAEREAQLNRLHYNVKIEEDEDQAFARSEDHLDNDLASDPGSRENTIEDEMEYEEWNGFSDEEYDDTDMIVDFRGDEDDPIVIDDIDEQIEMDAAQLLAPASPLDALEQPPAQPPTLAAASIEASTDAQHDPLTSAANCELTWSSHTQLVLFRQSASKIADDYLKDKGVKLRTGPRRRAGKSDVAAYRQGLKDSKKIDVKGNMISKGSK